MLCPNILESPLLWLLRASVPLFFKNHIITFLSIQVISYLTQRASSAVIETLFNETVPPDIDFGDSVYWKVKAGGFGGGRVVSLASMKITSDMVGRSVAASCTHNSPMWMHLETSLVENG